MMKLVQINELGETREIYFMTPTARELWNDKAFIERRIREQQNYQLKIGSSLSLFQISPYRFCELFHSSNEILIRFENRLEELNSLVAQSGEHHADIVKGNGS